MKTLSKTLLLFICLISLANCKRGGPMGGGGPMGDGMMGGGGGPCRRCNPNRGLANNDLIRERPNGLNAAPFFGAGGGGNVIDPGVGVPGSNPTIPEGGDFADEIGGGVDAAPVAPVSKRVNQEVMNHR